MSDKHQHQKFSPRNQVPQQKDEEDKEREEWTPTPEQMTAYLGREVVLAQGNLRVLLRTFREAISFKEIRDCMLHTAETIQAALDLEIMANRIKVDADGKFALA